MERIFVTPKEAKQVLDEATTPHLIAALRVLFPLDLPRTGGFDDIALSAARLRGQRDVVDRFEAAMRRKEKG